MNKIKFKEQGLTFIEIIVSLLLVGIVAAVVGLYIVNMVRSFMFASRNADTLLKGQIAITRIQKELNNIKKVSESSTYGIKFSSYRDAANHAIALYGTNLLLDNNAVLTDKVSHFSLAYYDNYNLSANTTFSANTRIIEANLVITGYENTPAEFKARITPSFDTATGS